MKGLDRANTMKKLKILVVEDNFLNQLLMEKILTRKGLNFEVAENGIIALQKLEESDYDLILMDIQMPEMNGIQATEAIRKNEKSTGKHISIVGVTAYLFDLEDIMSCGMDAIITKPYLSEDIYNAIEKYCMGDIPEKSIR